MKNCVTIVLLAVTGIIAVGCGQPKYRFREIEAYHQPLPFREASMYPGASVKNNVAVAAQISDDDTQERLFSYEIDTLGVLPVLVSITNNSSRPVLPLANDSILISGDSSLESADIQNLVDKARSKTRGGEIAFYIAMPLTFFIATGEINNDLQTIDEAKTIGIYNRVLREKVLAPGETMVGYLFYDKKSVLQDQKVMLRMDIQTLDAVEYFDINVSVSG